jgi:hypothetical protein
MSNVKNQGELAHEIGEKVAFGDLELTKMRRSFARRVTAWDRESDEESYARHAPASV